MDLLYTLTNLRSTLTKMGHQPMFHCNICMHMEMEEVMDIRVLSSLDRLRRMGGEKMEKSEHVVTLKLASEVVIVDPVKEN